MRLTCLCTTTQRGHPSLLPCVRSTSCLIPLTSTSLLLAFSFLFICLLTALARSPFSLRFNYVSSPFFSDALLLNTVPARSPPPSHNNGLMPHPIVPLPWHPFAYCLDCHPVAPLHHRAITLLPHRTIALAPLDPSPALSLPTPSSTHAQVRQHQAAGPIYGPTRCACLCHFPFSHPHVRHRPSLLIATNAVGMQVVSGASSLILFFPIVFFGLTPPTPCSRHYSFPWPRHLAHFACSM